MRDDRLRGLIQRIRNLEDERADINSDISSVFDEAKVMGYDTRVMRQVLKRMRLRREDRDEADSRLAEYEASIGLEGEAEAAVDFGPARKRESYSAPPDASSEQQLRAIISRVLELRAERVEQSQTIRLELKKARVNGFDPRKITEACVWLERCDKHGRDRMLASEELFQIYRDIGDGPQPELKVEGDSKLVAMFASGEASPAKKAPTLKQRQVSDAIAFAQISRMNRGLK